MPSKVWDEITYPFLNFNGCTIEVYEWISNYLSILGSKLNHSSKRGPWWYQGTRLCLSQYWPNLCGYIASLGHSGLIITCIDVLNAFVKRLIMSDNKQLGNTLYHIYFAKITSDASIKLENITVNMQLRKMIKHKFHWWLHLVQNMAIN